MKRLTLLTILLVVLGLTAGFALELKPSFTLSGWAKVEWGIDLNDMSTGFKNSAEGDLSVILFAEDTEDTHKGEGDWYGEITISNIELWWTADEVAGTGTWNADELGFEAKIVGLGGKLAIGVFDNPDLGSNVLCFSRFVSACCNRDKFSFRLLREKFLVLPVGGVCH